LKNQIEIKETKENFQIEDPLEDGIEIEFNNKKENSVKSEKKLNINFPKDYAKPLEIQLDSERTIFIEDENNNGFFAKLLKNENDFNNLNSKDLIILEKSENFFEKLFPKKQNSENEDK